MTDSESVLARMPKTELHLHLEGTVRPETLWDLADRAGVPLPAQTPEALRAKYVFDSFRRFLELWLAMHFEVRRRDRIRANGRRLHRRRAAAERPL